MTGKDGNGERFRQLRAPIVVQFMLAGATAFLLLGGLSVLLGIRARWGAVLLVVFLDSRRLDLS